MFIRTPEEHLVRIQAVLNKSNAAGLKIKPSKSELFRKQINYLGHVVGHKGSLLTLKNRGSYRVA